MRTLSIVGARPQFIKSAPVLRALSESKAENFLLHTGQHYDPLMSDIFFKELGIRSPDVNLHIGSGSANWQIGSMIQEMESHLRGYNPDWVIVFGDTNSTLAGTLAATKLGLKLAHVEAGLRSFNWTMPEEQNRVITDHCSQLKFCPTELAVRNLRNEGIKKGVHLIGDTMVDALNYFLKEAEAKSTVLGGLKITEKGYSLATVHRASNTDDITKLKSIVGALEESGENVIFPMHPRTRVLLEKESIRSKNVKFIDPVSYFDMLVLEKNSRLILTDSGGVQKEAFLLKVPCITLREETEWHETVEAECNLLVGTDKSKILKAIENHIWPKTKVPSVYGDGHASERIASILEAEL